MRNHWGDALDVCRNVIRRLQRQFYCATGHYPGTCLLFHQTADGRAWSCIGSGREGLLSLMSSTIFCRIEAGLYDADRDALGNRGEK
jgi:hypothetical protein